MFICWIINKSPSPTPMSNYAKAVEDPSWASNLRPLLPPGVSFTSYSEANLPPKKYSQLLDNVDVILELLGDSEDLNENEDMLKLWKAEHIHQWLVQAGGTDIVEAAISVLHHPEVTDMASFNTVSTKLAKTA